MQKDINFNDVAIVSIKGRVYKIHFWYMSEDGSINIMSATTYFQRNREKNTT